MPAQPEEWIVSEGWRDASGVAERRSIRLYYGREIGKEGEQGSIAKRWLRRTKKKC
jgi:hypothetical protein